VLLNRTVSEECLDYFGLQPRSWQVEHEGPTTHLASGQSELAYLKQGRS